MRNNYSLFHFRTYSPRGDTHATITISNYSHRPGILYLSIPRNIAHLRPIQKFASRPSITCLGPSRSYYSSFRSQIQNKKAQAKHVTYTLLCSESSWHNPHVQSPYTTSGNIANESEPWNCQWCKHRIYVDPSSVVCLLVLLVPHDGNVSCFKYIALQCRAPFVACRNPVMEQDDMNTMRPRVSMDVFRFGVGTLNV
jgi:hypothetical protein